MVVWFRCGDTKDGTTPVDIAAGTLWSGRLGAGTAGEMQRGGPNQ